MVRNIDSFCPPGADIKVIGIGGGGGNAINTMIRSKVEGVEFIVANTDVQALQFSLADRKIQLGRELTKGLGAGANPDIGRDAALEDRQAIQDSLEGANMVFVTCGMGGGTGTGGAAIVAQIAKDLGALVVGVVTKPFNFEGKKRRIHAENGINRLREHVDTLITIPNQKLLQIADADLSMIDSFKMADTVLVNAVKGISDIINVPGLVNVDFADVKTIMSKMGLALMGIGVSEGDGRAKEAATLAVSSPLLEDIDIEGATGILVNITAGEDIALREIDEICSIVQEAAHEECNIIFGAVIDDTLENQIKVTVIATGFPDEEKETTSSGAPVKKLESIQKNSQIKSEEILSFANVNSVFHEPELHLSPIFKETELPTTKHHFQEGTDLESNSNLEGASLAESEEQTPLLPDNEDSNRSLKETDPNQEVKMDEASEDDIDLPAYMRNGLKDLSLS